MPILHQLDSSPNKRSQTAAALRACHLDHATPHVYDAGPVSVSYQSVQANQGPYRAAFNRPATTQRCPARSIAVDPLEQPPGSCWLYYYTSATARGRKSTSELGHFTCHLDFALPPLNAIPSRPCQAQRRGTWQATAWDADGRRRLPRQLQRPGQTRPSNHRQPGE